jgi:hypothetical protein
MVREGKDHILVISVWKKESEVDSQTRAKNGKDSKLEIQKELAKHGNYLWIGKSICMVYQIISHRIRFLPL